MRQGRQLPILGARVPHRSPIRQQELGAPPPGFLLLARQPVAQRRHQIIVSQLIIFLSGLQRLRRTPFLKVARGVGRRDEA